MMERSFTQELSFWLIDMFGFEPGVAVLVALGLCFFAALFVAGGLAAGWEGIAARRKQGSMPINCPRKKENTYNQT